MATIATDRLYLIRVIPAQGLDAAKDLRLSRQMVILVAFFIILKGDS